MNRPDIDENELISMLGDPDENIRNIIYEKYGYIIDVLIKKYSRVITLLQIDEQELRCEASYGFSDGINCYIDSKNASLSTFLTLCVERRLQKYLKKETTMKAHFLREVLSLDASFSESETPLLETVGDESTNPLNNLTTIETFEEIISFAKENLSSLELQVFDLMRQGTSYTSIARRLEKDPKQVDNAIQRIKTKMRHIVTK